MRLGPKCRVCGSEHWLNKDHIWKGEVLKPSELCRSRNDKRNDEIANDVVTAPIAVVTVDLPFERLPRHEADPGFGPVPPRRKVVDLRPEPQKPESRQVMWQRENRERYNAKMRAYRAKRKAA